MDARGEGAEMPRKVTIELDGETYEVTELRSRENAAWRRKLEEPFSDLAETLEGAPGVELTDVASVAGLVRSVGGTLLQSIDLVKGLVIAYAPRLGEAVEEAYDSEILEAFGHILELAYPFGGLIRRLKELGSQSDRTTQNSRGQRGASGKVK